MLELPVKGDESVAIKKQPSACPACTKISGNDISKSSFTGKNSGRPNKQGTLRSLPALAISFLIAFFPKCPICWAAYASLFGSVSLARLPYQGWLYPVLLLFLGVHLYLLFRKRSVNGYGPFLLSLLGAAMLIGTRVFNFVPDNVLYGGMFCILVGSLWNSFSSGKRASSSIIKKLQLNTSSYGNRQ